VAPVDAPPADVAPADAPPVDVAPADVAPAHVAPGSGAARQCCPPPRVARPRSRASDAAAGGAAWLQPEPRPQALAVPAMAALDAEGGFYAAAGAGHERGALAYDSEQRLALWLFCCWHALS
jgi:hypothetical protein